jgi:DNA topoisomerase-1
MQLVIVESPAKAKTIEKYLGKDFKVLASYGHVRDLPPKDGSVRPDEDFAMDWELYRDKQSRFKEIADAAKKADRLVLATDPDREGEAISWHVRELLRNRKALPTKVDRVTFNAITKGAVTEAMKSPRELDQPLIDAYLARRALDYLYGFTLSPVLWRAPRARAASSRSPCAWCASASARSKPSGPTNIGACSPSSSMTAPPSMPGWSGMTARSSRS